MLTKASSRFSETEIDDEIVVMCLESGDFFSLTGTARQIWLLIDGTRGREALIAELTGVFGLAGNEIATDVDDFLAQLASAGLLVHD